MVKKNAIATKLTKICTQTQNRTFDVAVKHFLKKCCMEVGFSKFLFDEVPV